MENFDAVGQWRTEDNYESTAGGGGRKTWTIDPAATLYKGPSFQSFAAMRDLIATKQDEFATGFTSALIEYAWVVRADSATHL